MLSVNKKALQEINKLDADSPTNQDIEKAAAITNDPNVWKSVSILATQAQDEFIKLGFSNPDYLSKDCDSLRADLGYHQSPAHEKLIIENIILTHLRLSHLELSYTNMQREAKSQGNGIATATVMLYEKRIALSRRQHLHAIESLARVRKLGITVNLVDKQLNLCKA